MNKLMSLTPTNHADGVLHVIVDATGNNSLHTFLIFNDLIGGAVVYWELVYIRGARGNVVVD